MKSYIFNPTYRTPRESSGPSRRSSAALPPLRPAEPASEPPRKEPPRQPELQRRLQPCAAGPCQREPACLRHSLLGRQQPQRAKWSHKPSSPSSTRQLLPANGSARQALAGRTRPHRPAAAGTPGAAWAAGPAPAPPLTSPQGLRLPLRLLHCPVAPHGSLGLRAGRDGPSQLHGQAGRRGAPHLTPSQRGRGDGAGLGAPVRGAGPRGAGGALRTCSVRGWGGGRQGHNASGHPAGPAPAQAAAPPALPSRCAGD